MRFFVSFYKKRYREAQPADKLRLHALFHRTRTEYARWCRKHLVLRKSDERTGENTLTYTTLIRIQKEYEYTDECIRRCILSQRPKFTFYLVDSMARPDMVVKRKTPLGDVLSILAPVHRGSHWVLYTLGREEACGLFMWHFGDSMGNLPLPREIRRITEVLRAFTTGYDWSVIPDVCKDLEFPKQKDVISCGVYATEGALRFLRRSGGDWRTPNEMRDEHFGLAAGILE